VRLPAKVLRAEEEPQVADLWRIRPWRREGLWLPRLRTAGVRLPPRLSWGALLLVPGGLRLEAPV